MTERERLLDELRSVAFAIAYRMLGSLSDAEDVVQEALLRVHQALDAGELPEPILTDSLEDPYQQAEVADSLSLAMLVLLESLSPEQRAVLLLHDVFDYPFAEIAAIVGKSEENARKLATRARRHVEQRRPRFQTTRGQRDELARRFFQAAEQGDLAGLEALLDHDVALTGDGGGRVRRSRRRCAGAIVSHARSSTGSVLGPALLVCRCALSKSTAPRERSTSTHNSGYSA